MTQPGRDWKFWIWPKYRLETPTVCIVLRNKEGELLSMLLARPGMKIFTDEIFDAMYEQREDGGPIRHILLINVFMANLRKNLREVGIDIRIDSKRWQKSYTFERFDACEPTWKPKIIEVDVLA